MPWHTAILWVRNATVVDYKREGIVFLLLHHNTSNHFQTLTCSNDGNIQPSDTTFLKRKNDKLLHSNEDTVFLLVLIYKTTANLPEDSKLTSITKRINKYSHIITLLPRKGRGQGLTISSAVSWGS